jgi:hypothetical protein
VSVPWWGVPRKRMPYVDKWMHLCEKRCSLWAALACIRACSAVWIKHSR